MVVSSFLSSFVEGTIDVGGDTEYTNLWIALKSSTGETCCALEEDTQAREEQSAMLNLLGEMLLCAEVPKGDRQE